MEKEREGKAACKSGKITWTPACPILAAVTPKASKREQANNKKWKQIRKQQLEEFFGQGPQVTAPSKEGTPINAVLQRRARGLDHDKGKRGETNSSLDKATKMTKPKKQQQPVDTREVHEAKKKPSKEQAEIKQPRIGR